MEIAFCDDTDTSAIEDWNVVNNKTIKDIIAVFRNICHSYDELRLYSVKPDLVDSSEDLDYYNPRGLLDLNSALLDFREDYWEVIKAGVVYSDYHVRRNMWKPGRST